jgi:hypothetical protein
MNTGKFIIIAVLLLVLLTACGGAPAVTEAPIVPTDTSIPTEEPTIQPTETYTPEPTATATTAPTATPEGQIFHDDFSGGLMEGWTWQEEKPDRWTFTSDGWLEIRGEDPGLLSSGHQSNLLCRPAPEGDYQITIHVFAETFANFQQATLYVYQDADNYIALNKGFCDRSFCMSMGSAMFMEYKMAGSLGSYKTKTDDPDVFIRLVVAGTSIIGYYAFEPDAWQKFGSIGNFIKNPNICLGVTNLDEAGAYSDDLTGRFDYIDISLP